MRRWLVTAALAATVGCKTQRPVSSDAAAIPAPGGAVADDNAEPWPIKSTEYLELVPADTPYVLLNDAPLPADFVDRLQPIWTELLAQYEKQADASTMELLGGEVTAESIRRFGFEPNPKFVVYGLGLAPVFRVRLHDPDKIARYLDGDGESWERADFHGQSYRYERDASDGTLTVYAVVGPDFVIALLPPGGIQQRLLPYVFGQQLPPETLASSGRAGRLRSKHGLTPHWYGFFDLAGVIATVSGQTSGLDHEVAKAFGEVTGSRSPQCAAEVARLAEAAPQIVFGFDEVSAAALTASVTMEVGPRIRRELSRISAPIAGLPPDDRFVGAIDLGMGIDLRATQRASQALVDHVREQPFSCASLLAMNGLPTAVHQLTTAVPPKAAAQLTGFGASIFDGDFGTGDKVPDGVFVVGVRNPARALAEVGKLAPDLSLDKLERSTRPVPLRSIAAKGADLSKLRDAVVIRGPKALALATGKRGRAGIKKAVRRRRPNDGTIAIAAFDMVALTKKSTSSMDALETPAQRRLARAYVKAFGRLRFSLELTERGIELESSMRPAR